MGADADQAPTTEAGVVAVLRHHFAPPKYALVTGVRNDSGWSATRTCDALAIGVWQSTKHDLHGIEIKTSRADWLREIQDPNKAEAFAAYCDYWWIAAPKGVLRLEELPASWGHLEVGAKVFVRRPGSKREVPLPVDRGLLACFARRCIEQSPAEEEVKAAVRRAREEFQREMREAKITLKARAKAEADAEVKVERSAQALLEEFGRRTGVHLSAWNIEREAEAFRLFREGKQSESELRDRLVAIRERIDAALNGTEA